MNFSDRLVQRPDQVLRFFLCDGRLDTMRRIGQQHVPERSVEDAVLPDAGRCCRPFRLHQDQAELDRGPKLELVFEPVEGRMLVFLEEVLGCDDAIHETNDENCHYIMRIRMIRRNLTWITEILRAVLFREPQHLGTRRRIQRVAQAARLALINTLLLCQQRCQRREL